MRANSLKFLVLVLGLVSIVVFSPSALLMQPNNHKDMAVIEVMKLKLDLARRGNHPAVILGGGSNVLTGLHAKAMSVTLKRPVYNMALTNEGGDYRNVIELLEATARPGDLIVYSSRGFYMNPPRIQDPLPINVEGVKFLTSNKGSPWSFPNESFVRLLIPTSELTKPPFGRLENFNTYGDFTRCLHARKVLKPTDLNPDYQLNDEYWQAVSDFSKRMEAREIPVFLLTPDLLVAEQDLQKWYGVYQRIIVLFKESKVRVLSIPLEQNFATDPSSFCDTILHPNAQRGLLRSQAIAAELVNWN
jgi:hypothetical protein